MSKYLTILCGMLAVLATSTADASRRTLEQSLYEAAGSQTRPWYKPGSTARGALESDDAYDARLRVIATAVSDTTVIAKDGRAAVPEGWKYSRKDLAAMLLAHWREESKYALEVHEGSKHPVWTQDMGKAKCLGQLQESRLVPKKAWERLAGVDEDATKRCAAYTAKVLIRMQLWCARLSVLTRQPVTKEQLFLHTFSALRLGHCKKTGHGARKLATYKRIMRRL